MAPEKPEWKLNGQTLTLTFPLSETIANVKSKVQDELTMPPAKQKLFYDVHFFYLYLFVFVFITEITVFIF